MTLPTRLPPQTDPPLSPRLTLPTMYDLPSEDPEEPGLPDTFHPDQSQFLGETFQPRNCEIEEVFTAMDLNLYYDIHHPNWYKRPDWFAVVGVPRLYEGHDIRLSYVMWQELVSPFVVVELLSPGTADEDLGNTVQSPGKPPTKWQVYEQILRVPYYIVFSRYTDRMQAFRLVASQYEPAAMTDGRLPIPQLGLSLGLWQGSYKNLDRLWLRWFTLEGELIPIPSEQVAQAHQQVAEAQQQTAQAQQQAAQAQQQVAQAHQQTAQAHQQTVEAQQQTAQAQQQAVEAQQRATLAEQQAAQVQQQAERLAAKLRELGIDPEQLE